VVSHMLKDGYLADMPIVIAAIDPCFSCTDRSIAVSRQKSREVITWEQMRLDGIEWHRKRGIDFRGIK